MKKTNRAYKSDKRKKEVEKQKKQEIKRKRRFHQPDSENEQDAAPESEGTHETVQPAE